MVDTEEVQDGGMEVVDVDSVFHSLVAKFVTCSVVGTSLDASSGHPHGEGVGIMVSTLTALCVGGAPFFLLGLGHYFYGFCFLKRFRFFSRCDAASQWGFLRVGFPCLLATIQELGFGDHEEASPAVCRATCY